MLLAQVTLRPIHVIRSGLARLGRGELDVKVDLPEDAELAELGDSFKAVSARLAADRTALAGQKATLESVVDTLEDAVALFGPTGCCCSPTRRCGPSLTGHDGRPRGACFAADHPYRAIVAAALGVARGLRARARSLIPGRRRAAGPRASGGGRRRRAARRHAGLAQSVVPERGGIDAELLAQAGGARPPVGRHRPRGEEPAQRDDDSPRAAAR